MRYLPRWTPFIKFRKDAEIGKKMVMDLVNKPFERVIDEMVSFRLFPFPFCYFVLIVLDRELGLLKNRLLGIC